MSNILEKIQELVPDLEQSNSEDTQQMAEDIYYYFGELDKFEVLRIRKYEEPNLMVTARCMSTLTDPFFKIMIAYTWERDLAFDNEWFDFEEAEEGTIFRFLTWEEDGYISGEIYFERVKAELQK